MRNLKKLLALVLALVMTMSLMVTANAAKTSYSDDADIADDYAVAVKVLTDMGIFKGTSTGTQTFNPKGKLTRAEASALIYRLLSKDVLDKQNSLYNIKSFDDVAVDSWDTGYITYAANGRYVIGDGQGKFYPTMEVTGTQVLAIMLRAIGYGRNNEYQGNGWEIRVMTDAKELGLTQSVSEGILNQPATREVVAQLLWNTLTKGQQVVYTAGLGYLNSNKNNPKLDKTGKTFGQLQFDLSDGTESEDKWGTPCTKYTFKTDKGTSSTIENVAVFSTEVRVDECDVVKAIDPDNDTDYDIESCWIDGYKFPSVEASAVTSDALGQINAQDTKSYLGAQGRETKVYMMASGDLRIVEKNTYLAQVVKYNKVTTDKNGHTTDATIDINIVYTGSNTDSRQNAVYAQNNYSEKVYKAAAVKTGEETYTAGEFILVNAQFNRYDDGWSTKKDPMEDVDYWILANKTPKDRVKVEVVENVRRAELVSAGIQTAHKQGYLEGNYNSGNPGEVTFKGGKSYTCADKFFYNHLDSSHKIFSQSSKSWTAIMDGKGNVIGLTTGSTSLMIIEGVRWVGDGSTVYGGKAMAQILKEDGTRDTVTLGSINGKVPTHTGRSTSDPTIGTVDTSWADNGAYYRHLYTYTVNADGTYAISGHVTGGIENSRTGNIDHNVYGWDKHAATDPAPTGINAGKDKMGTITKGASRIYLGYNFLYVPVDNDTMFLVADNIYSTGPDAGHAIAGTQYTPYHGKDNVPSMTKTEVCYALGADGFASVVVVSAYKSASNVFGAYVPYQSYSTSTLDADREDLNATYRQDYGWYFEVYKIGETTPTGVWFNHWELGVKTETGDRSTYGIFQDALYVLEIDSEGRIVTNDGTNTTRAGENDLNQNMIYGMVGGKGFADAAIKATPEGDAKKNDAYAPANGGDAFDLGVVNGNAKSLGNGAIGIYGTDKLSENPSSSFPYDFAYTMNVDSATKLILIGRYADDTANLGVSELDLTDLRDGDKVSVVYDMVGSQMVAKCIYILRDLNVADPTYGVTLASSDFAVYGATRDSVGAEVYMVLKDAVDGKKATYLKTEAANNNLSYTVSIDNGYGKLVTLYTDKVDQNAFEAVVNPQYYGLSGTKWVKIAGFGARTHEYLQLANREVYEVTITLFVGNESYSATGNIQWAKP